MSNEGDKPETISKLLEEFTAKETLGIKRDVAERMANIMTKIIRNRLKIVSFALDIDHKNF